MAIYDNLPYTNFHEMNLDWVVKTVKEVKDKTDEIDDAVDTVTDAKNEVVELEAKTRQLKEDTEDVYQDTEDVYETTQNLLSDLTQQVTTNTNDIAVHTGEIAAIISGTTPDANVELLDIRVGYDGTTYSTAGDAVRGQVTDLHDDISDFTNIRIGGNLFDVDSADTLIGSYRNGSNTVVSDNKFICTNMIDVRNISKVYCKQFGTRNNVTFLQALRYDANGDFIERYNIPGGGAAGTNNEYTVTTESFVRFNVQYAAAQESLVPQLARQFMLATFPITYFQRCGAIYTTDKIKIHKVNSDNISISFGNAEVLLYYTNNPSREATNWNVGTVKLRGNILASATTDILGPIKLVNAADFVGGVHGYEHTNYIYLCGDGFYYTPAEVDDDIIANKLSLVMSNDVYAYGTSTKIATRIVQIIFEDNKMTVNNTYTAETAFNLERLTSGGLMAAYSADIKGISFNNRFLNSAPSSAVNLRSADNTVATIYTGFGSVTVHNILGHQNENYLGHLGVFANEINPRCKIYFDTYKTGNYAIAINQSLSGTFEYIFA